MSTVTALKKNVVIHDTEVLDVSLTKNIYTLSRSSRFKTWTKPSIVFAVYMYFQLHISLLDGQVYVCLPSPVM